MQSEPSEAARFLCDRVRELETDMEDGVVASNYYGHVVPALSRLEAALAALPPSGEVERLWEAAETALPYILNNGESARRDAAYDALADALAALRNSTDGETK